MSSSNVSGSEAPKRSLILRELRAAREPLRLVLRSKRLLGAPNGSGGVMVIPGFSANDAAMAPLRAYLRRLGYTTWGWGLGTNRGQVEANLATFIDQVERRFEENGARPIALCGWSLGGVFAREVTRHRPELVSQIITMATPIHDDQVDGRNSALIERPITAFYTKRDGVVDWRICTDEVNPNVKNIEVTSSHLGIIIDPTVWLETADRLASRLYRSGRS